MPKMKTKSAAKKAAAFDAICFLAGIDTMNAFIEEGTKITEEVVNNG